MDRLLITPRSKSAYSPWLQICVCPANAATQAAATSAPKAMLVLRGLDLVIDKNNPATDEYQWTLTRTYAWRQPIPPRSLPPQRSPVSTLPFVFLSVSASL